MYKSDYILATQSRLLGYVQVDDSTACWNWTSATIDGKRGVVSFFGKQWNAAKVSMLVFTGRLAELQVCHTCDNTACINPDHLFEGTQKDNITDCIRKGRFKIHVPAPSFGETNFQARLTTEQVTEIRAIGSSRSRKEIAAQFGTTPATVWNILKGKTRLKG